METNPLSPKKDMPSHGGARGSTLARRSPMFEGRFGRMFRTLPAAVHDSGALVKLGKAMAADPEKPFEGKDEVDAEENNGLPAGYTYFGQFIDHDLTFDPTSSLSKQNDPDALVDFRTPRFDLDCVYGRGPDDQPYLYEDKGVTGGLTLFKLGEKLTGASVDPFSRDLPRAVSTIGGAERAIIGDPRNDENVIVSQLQSHMLRFHNQLAVANGKNWSFDEAQQAMRWTYQWIVLNDFLPRLVGQDMIDDILPGMVKGSANPDSTPHLRFYKFHVDAYIPIEFSTAAYRFGHSSIRPNYRLSQTVPRFPIFNDKLPDGGLNGFRKFPRNWAIDWNLFFPMTPKPPTDGPGRLQFSYRIDTSLVDPLAHLPASIASNPASLGERNLLRGLRMGLPSGQAVARAMGLVPIADAALVCGKATSDDLKDARPLVSVDRSFAGNAPLWYYILAEAMQGMQKNPKKIDRMTLGPVGGRIVAETFIGLMQGDSHSYLAQDARWTPASIGLKNFSGMPDLIKTARLYEHKPR